MTGRAAANCEQKHLVTGAGRLHSCSKCLFNRLMESKLNLQEGEFKIAEPCQVDSVRGKEQSSSWSVLAQAKLVCNHVMLQVV
jgi:hypothetical protein